MKNESHSTATSAPNGRHWMDAYGIKFEERLTVTKAQLELKMRPCFPLKTRIWAYLILHTAGYQGEHAQTMKGGHKTAVQPPDIADELQKAAARYYRKAGVMLDKPAFDQLRPGPTDMRRALAQMEEDGICERRYKGTTLRSMPVKERQSRLNGKIDLYVWLRPKEANPENVKQEYQESANLQLSQSSLPEISMSQIIKHFQKESERLSLYLRHLKPEQQKAVSEAWEGFLQVVKECLPEADAQCLPEAVTQSLPSIREEIEEEILTETPPPPPPVQEQSEDPTTRMRRTAKANSYPLTLAELRAHDPAVKEAFVKRLFSDTVNYCEKHPDFPKKALAHITDRTLAAMCKESFATGPKNHGIGLLLSRVPAIAITWSQENEPTTESERRSA